MLACLQRGLIVATSSVLVIVLTIGATAAQHTQNLEKYTDRPGSDYDMFELGPDVNAAAACKQACASDNRCQAWSAVAIGASTPNAKCLLKSSIPVAQPNECCTSGVPIRPLEPNIDRPGSDYLSFALTGDDPEHCRRACADDKRCRAWTYVRPGLHGTAAMCHLKDIVPLAFTNGCCTSGASGFGE